MLSFLCYFTDALKYGTYLGQVFGCPDITTLKLKLHSDNEGIPDFNGNLTITGPKGSAEYHAEITRVNGKRLIINGDRWITKVEGFDTMPTFHGVRNTVNITGEIGGVICRDARFVLQCKYLV